MYFLLLFGILSLCDATRISTPSGLNTSIIEYPHQVTILKHGVPTCSGALITRQHIITAASCTYNTTIVMLRVRLGSSDQNKNGIVKSIYRIYEHPKYNPKTYDYNIAILTLWDEVDIIDEIIPITVVNRSVPLNKSVEVIGWGTIDNYTSASRCTKYLQRVVLTTIDRKKCQEIYNVYNLTITEHMFCANTESNGYGTCHDDIGATLLYNSDLYGILSYQIGCAIKKYPGVYIHIPYFYKFINYIIHGLVQI